MRYKSIRPNKEEFQTYFPMNNVFNYYNIRSLKIEIEDICKEIMVKEFKKKSRHDITSTKDCFKRTKNGFA